MKWRALLLKSLKVHRPQVLSIRRSGNFFSQLPPPPPHQHPSVPQISLRYTQLCPLTISAQKSKVCLHSEKVQSDFECCAIMFSSTSPDLCRHGGRFWSHLAPLPALVQPATESAGAYSGRKEVERKTVLHKLQNFNSSKLPG